MHWRYSLLNLIKKIAIKSTLLLALIIPSAYAGGGITHMLVAKEAINYLPEANLRHILLNNMDAYLVGSNYPDTGFVQGTEYGEDSHWDPFIFTLTDYIKEKYQNPLIENPKLVAFLFGCAAHSKSDIIMHWTFYPKSATEDFNGNWDKAHYNGDFPLDLVVNVEKNQWGSHPDNWWVPVQDLVKIYQRMGRSQYTAKQIILGNSVYYFAGIGERAIAGLAYPIIKKQMPWTAKNYYTAPEGGLVMDEQEVAQYQMQVWYRLTDNKLHATPNFIAHPEKHTGTDPAVEIATTEITSGAVKMPIIKQTDGSVEIQQPEIKGFAAYQNYLNKLLEKIQTT